MKKILLSFMFLALSALAKAETISYTVVQTSGTATVTQTRTDRWVSGGYSELSYFTITWVSDSAASGSLVITMPAIRGTIVQVETDPGTAAPTDNYDIYLIDAYGVDLFNGAGLNRDTANSEIFAPFISTYSPPRVSGVTTFKALITGSAKHGVCVIFIKP